MQMEDQHGVQLQQHAVHIADGLFDKAMVILDKLALPGLFAVAAKSWRELALARSLSGEISAQFARELISALETLIVVVKMAAEGTASSVIKHCPLLAQALKKLKVLPEAGNYAEGSNNNDDFRNTRWVLPVEVHCTRYPKTLGENL